TPRGVLPLKFFFSSALATASGEDASARSIRAKLEKMVAEEDPKKPLTDQQIVHLFQEQGIQIARRTVAKYRDQLGILPARIRKRECRFRQSRGWTSVCSCPPRTSRRTSPSFS